jgi:hypothetical protein
MARVVSTMMSWSSRSKSVSALMALMISSRILSLARSPSPLTCCGSSTIAQRSPWEPANPPLCVLPSPGCRRRPDQALFPHICRRPTAVPWS